MVIYVSFDEMHDYISAHYKKDLSVSKVSEKEFCLTFTQRIIIKDVRINVNIHIDEVKSESLALTYSGGMALDMIISRALSFLTNKLPELSQGITTGENRQIRINLFQIEKAKPIVQNLSLKDLQVEDKALKLTVSLK